MIQLEDILSVRDLSSRKQKKVIKRFLPKLREIEYTSIVKQDLEECCTLPREVPSLVGRNFDSYCYYYVKGKSGGLFSFGIRYFEDFGLHLLDLQYIVARKSGNGFGTNVINFLIEKYPNYTFIINSVDSAVKFYEKFGFEKVCLAKD